MPSIDNLSTILLLCLLQAIAAFIGYSVGKLLWNRIGELPRAEVIKHNRIIRR